MAHKCETLIFLYRQLVWKQKDVTCLALLSQCLSSLPLEFRAFCSFVSGFGHTGFNEVRVRVLR